MHEFSLMQGIMDSVRPVAQENGATKVTKISLTIGEMTQVVEEAMTFAFEALTDDDPLFSGAQLEMEFVEPRSKCLDCGTEFSHDRFHLKCPECNSPITTVLQGKEMHIASIEVETEEE